LVQERKVGSHEVTSVSAAFLISLSLARDFKNPEIRIWALKKPEKIIRASSKRNHLGL
jgi:hypothetical protein